MSDFMEIGATPPGEDCAAAGFEGYYQLYRVEMEAYIKQLRRQFGPEPEGARLIIKSFPHDSAGEYHEVCVRYRTRAGLNYALKIESEGPENWDGEARKELEEAGYFDKLTAQKEKLERL